MVERGATGLYNATGPAETLTLGRMLERIRSATGNRAELVWIDEDRLAGAGVEPWDQLPVWLDLPRHAALRGFLAVDVSRALGAGLELRPLEDTVNDTLAWTRTRDGLPRTVEGILLPPRAGLTREREAQLLEELAG
jgi:2'-hydroxyisoflavone reductase